MERLSKLAQVALFSKELNEIKGFHFNPPKLKSYKEPIRRLLQVVVLIPYGLSLKLEFSQSCLQLCIYDFDDKCTLHVAATRKELVWGDRIFAAPGAHQDKFLSYNNALDVRKEIGDNHEMFNTLRLEVDKDKKIQI